MQRRKRSHNATQQPRDDSEDDLYLVEEEGEEEEVSRHRPRQRPRASRAQTQISDQEDGASSTLHEDVVGDRPSQLFVRTVLCAERKRLPIKREDIIRIALPTNSRAFKDQLREAQKQLKDVFGMELCETPGKEARVNIRTANGTQIHRKTGAYTLRSTLPASVIALAPPIGEADKEIVGLAMTLLSLIYVHGHSLEDAKLRLYLRILRVPIVEEEEGVPAQSQRARRRLEGAEVAPTLERLQRDGYIEKVATSKVRPQEGQRGSEGRGPRYVWMWGPRAKVEVTDDAILAFIGEMYGEDETPELLAAARKASTLDGGPTET